MDYGQFQEELGAKKGNLDYQGYFKLTGSRQSKIAVSKKILKISVILD